LGVGAEPGRRLCAALASRGRSTCTFGVGGFI